jgi:hypothetical protein
MRLTLTVVAAALICSRADAASLVLNGDFELGNPTSQTADNWTSSATIDSAGGWRAINGHPGGYFILNAAGQTTSNPTISQAISGLLPGNTYRITGEFIRRFPGGANANEFGVEIDNQLFTFDLTDGVNWTAFERTFTYTGASNLLILSGERINDNAPGVDNIGIDVVPEPAAFSTLAVTGALLIRRRRR